MTALAGGDLAPLTPDDGDGYRSTVRKALLGDGGAYQYDRSGWMICMPSFACEYALIIDFSGDSPQIISRRATEAIWHYKDAEGGDLRLDLRSNVKVSSRTRTIDGDLAKRIKELWENTVKRSHYDDEASGGLDGETYEFNAGNFYFGETWYPTGGSAGALVDLGNALMNYTEDRKNAPSEKDIAGLLDQLEEKLASAKDTPKKAP